MVTAAIERFEAAEVSPLMSNLVARAASVRSIAVTALLDEFSAMTGVGVALPDPAVKPLVHPADLPEARALHLRGW